MECGKKNDMSAKYCESCGKALPPSQEQESQEQEFAQAEVNMAARLRNLNGKEYLDKGKKASKAYLSYCLFLLKKPFSAAQTIGREELINGITTIILFALLIPLMAYFGLKNILFYELIYSDISFLDVVIIPFIGLLFFILMVCVIAFGALKIGNNSVHILDVVSRLGAFTVVPMVLVAIAFIVSLFQSVLFTLFLSLGLLAFSFIIPLLVHSFKNENTGGLDSYYCTFLTYIGMGLILFIIGEKLFQSLIEVVNSSIWY